MGVFLILAVVVFLVSPRKLRTLGRMALAFVITGLVIMIPAALARRGDPQMWGRIAGEIAIAIAIAPLAGWWHIRSLKRAAKRVEERHPSNP
jgi:thiol:disulfide interchange protein